MKFRSAAMAVTVLCLLPEASLAAANEQAAKPGVTNPFFALCVSTHDPHYRTPADQARLLKELGYDGMAHVWLDGVEGAIKAADDNRLKLSQVYIRAWLAPGKPKYDRRLKQVIRALKDRQTILGLMIQGKPPSTEENDPQAVEIVREIAEMARKSGIRVALYPHVGDWLERVEDAVRVAKKVDRDNVGVIFNLCHWLAVDDRRNLRPLIELAIPHLFVVTVNGSNRDVSRSQREGWIQTLDRGTYDVGKFIRTLRESGYTGPVGLQCYGITGDVRDNLKRSIDAWREFSANPSSAKPRLRNRFFAFDNGTGRLAPQAQAKMLKQLGYAGIGYTGSKGIPEMLDALDRQGLKMFSIYVGASLGPEGPTYDPNLKEAVEALKGRQTIVWLFITGEAPDGDKQAVRVVREIAELAGRSGLRVALYPHVGFHVARVEDALRVAEKVDRENVGVSLNLCHWLKLDHEKNLRPLVKAAIGRLLLVSINGADHGETKKMGWDRLIQTLDRGSFDVGRFLKTLEEFGYHGPVGLQCYAVKGDARENLERSMAAWREFSAAIAVQEKSTP